MADYYKVLGVSSTSSASEIDRAFYKLKAKFNSDDTEDPYFKNFYRRILEAHNVLSNAERRSRYDENYKFEEFLLDKKEKVKEDSEDPFIEYFKTNKKVMETGEKIILSWKILNADDITLIPFGKTEAIGSKIIHYEDFAQNKIHFRLQVRNTSLKKEISKDLCIDRVVEESKPKVPVEKNKNHLEAKPDIHIGNQDVRLDSSKQSNIKKYAVPSGVVVLLVAIILFVLGKSGFWESNSQSEIDEILSNVNYAIPEDTTEIEDSNEEIFIEKSMMLNGETIFYYDPELIFNQLFLEIEKYSIPNVTGFHADVKQFFNSSDNPIEWRGVRSSENGITYTSQLGVGVMQEPFSMERESAIERLNLKKTGVYNTSLLSMVEFEIQDSGPPFWEPNEKWEAFQKLFTSKFEKVILTDELNVIKEVYSLNQIPSGKAKGYIVMKAGLRIPISFSKETIQDQPTTFKIKIYSSMNALMGRNEYFTRIEKEGRILNLKELENYRDFDLISQFYSDNVMRYWDDYNLNHEELKTLYQTAWSNTQYSINDIQDIEMYDEQNFELITNFNYLNKDGDTITQLGSTQFTFNEEGLIEAVYGVDSDYTYQDYRDDDFNNISEETKLKRLLQAEDNRDYLKIASFYSADMKRYWHMDDPTFIQINNIYQDAWEVSSYSRNNILKIEFLGNKTYDVKVRFTFRNNKTNKLEDRESFTRYIFNENGLIAEVYGLENKRF